MIQLIKDAYKTWGAEVVFITSNWQGNREIMEGCKEVGIPAFVCRLSPNVQLAEERTSHTSIPSSQGTLWDF